MKSPVEDRTKLAADTAGKLQVRSASTALQTMSFLVLTVPVCGEQFLYLFEGSDCSLRHQQWSLAGFGANRNEAEEDLLAEAKELGAVLQKRDPMTLSEEARRLRDFCLRAR